MRTNLAAGRTAANDFRLNAIQAVLPLGHELIIDNFAGGGGTSEGLEQAFGRPVDIAINHDPEALAMHAANHPRTRHLLESVWDVDPLAVTGGRPVALVWLSPDCKHFSKAKGGTPVAKHIRGLAWVGLRWIALTKPRVLMLENVEEFQDWGPLKCVVRDGEEVWMPDPAKKGITFQSFVRQIRAHGYKVEWRELRACDNDAPTTRKRLFLIARRDGLPIEWPAQTNGAPTSAAVIAGKLNPWRTAAECIDFGIAAKSIFGRKKELVKNTRRRVAKGLWRHVLTSERPFIVGGAPNEPIQAPFVGDQSRPAEAKTASAGEPLRTQCAQVKGGHFTLVTPTLHPVNEDSILLKETGHEQVAKALALAPMRGTSDGHMNGHSVEDPLSTISAGGTHHGLVGANLVTIGYGERKGQQARTQEMEHPLGTVVAGGVKSAVSMAHMTKFRTGSSGQSLHEPAPTVTANSFVKRPGGAAPLGLVSAYCIKYYSSGGQWQPLDDPMHTLPTKGRMGLVQTMQVPIDALSPEHRERAKLCAELLHEHLPEHFAEPADLVLFYRFGQWWVLVDITLRMLKPRELFNAQGFPPDYIIDWIPDPAKLFSAGVQVVDPLSIPRIPLSATAQVRMCGNSVSPKQSKALALANFKHEALFGRQSKRPYRRVAA